ncbi:biofilm regulation protein phosphatase SiaA [Thauera aromatica]|nr:biofilm regulation protein phosphatase SiaA [Thauera aromatica]MCK2126698.1 biofilm regulation protein phosphatase SiaA [Thauera aromatica]
MPTWGHGLRAKSALALLLACLFALLPAAFFAWRAFDEVKTHLGEGYARNFTELHRERILGPIARELALAQRLADSVAVRHWLRDEQDASRRAQAFEETESFRQAFRDHSYFLASSASLDYYYNDPAQSYSAAPRYRLDPQKVDDAWFFSTLAAAPRVNINVNPDRWLKQARVWLNVVIEDDGRRLGIAGSGLDLSRFMKEFIDAGIAGLTPMIIDRSGAIQLHPDARLIALGSGARHDAQARTLDSLLGDAQERDALHAALDRAAAAPGAVEQLWVTLDGGRRLLSLSYLAELRWYVLTAVDLSVAEIVDRGWVQGAAAGFALLIVLMLASFSFAVDRLVLRPLKALHHSALALARGETVRLPPPGRDELGDLSRAFGAMAAKIRAHTAELEDKVRTRTEALQAANTAMSAAQKKVRDSIEYASLIQRALLPDQRLSELLGPHHFALWRPRDTVGGDFYLFRAEGEHNLLGIVDCAGHGVPGALMTMLARAAFDDAMNRIGLARPAALLAHADRTLRGMLQASQLPRAIATNMDAGLVCVDRGTRRILFAGAKISLYWSDGDTVAEIPGVRRALADRRQAEFVEHSLALPAGATCYLVTDGYLDQAGGEHGFGLGNSRFAELLRTIAQRPMAEQAQALDQALDAHRGHHPQLDDITILAFRID